MPKAAQRGFLHHLKAFVIFVDFVLDTAFGFYKNERSLFHHADACKNTVLIP